MAKLHSVERIGTERQPVARFRDALADPASVRARAAEMKFARINPHYPGVRAEVDAALLAQLVAFVEEAAPLMGLSDRRWRGQAWHSIVTAPARALTPFQRLPHFDGLDPRQLAIMLYLNETAHGGTRFFRHKDTGFETIDAARYPIFKASLHEGVARAGLPAARYIGDGEPLFETIWTAPPEFNSLIVYRGAALHSGVIAPDAPLSADALQGRLTINGFFQPIAD